MDLPMRVQVDALTLGKGMNDFVWVNSSYKKMLLRKPVEPSRAELVELVRRSYNVIKALAPSDGKLKADLRKAVDKLK